MFQTTNQKNSAAPIFFTNSKSRSAQCSACGALAARGPHEDVRIHVVALAGAAEALRRCRCWRRAKEGEEAVEGRQTQLLQGTT